MIMMVNYTKKIAMRLHTFVSEGSIAFDALAWRRVDHDE